MELSGDDHMPALGADDIVDEIEEFLTGVRPAPASDRILATILFSDLVGSTERVESLGDAAWASLLGSHHEAVRRQLARFSGEEVDTAGDGFLAVFDGPGRFAALSRFAKRCVCSASMCEPEYTRVRSSVPPGVSLAVSLFTWELGSCRSQERATCS